MKMLLNKQRISLTPGLDTINGKLNPCVWLLLFFVLQGAWGSLSQAETSFGVLDVRRDLGGGLVRSSARISPVGESPDADAVFRISGQVQSGWSAAAPVWNASGRRDGWYSAELREKDDVHRAELAVLNDSRVVFHGGVLERDEIWAADRIHLVRHWVRIPAGRTLTVKPGAIVKFCSHTGIQADGVFNAAAARFTGAGDDSLGGDTDMNGTGKNAGNESFQITGTGQINAGRLSAQFFATPFGPLDMREQLEGEKDVPATAYDRLDVRDDLGGRMIRGTERIASLAESTDGQPSLTVNGVRAEGWTAEGQLWNSQKMKDGWYPFVLTESGSTYNLELAVLNDPKVAVHAGVLANDESWGADRVHLIRHWVRIPRGMTLTVQDGAVLKFCRDTGIQVDGVLKGNRIQMLPADDDRLGGDTDMKAVTESQEWLGQPLTGRGTVQLTDSALFNGCREYVSLSLVPGWNFLSLPAGMALNQLGNRPMMALAADRQTQGNRADRYVFYRDRISDGRAFWCFHGASEKADLNLVQDAVIINSSVGKLMQKGCSLGVSGTEEVHVRKDVYGMIMQWNNGRFKVLKTDSDGGYTFQPGQGYIVQ